MAKQAVAPSAIMSSMTALTIGGTEDIECVARRAEMFITTDQMAATHAYKVSILVPQDGRIGWEHTTGRAVQSRHEHGCPMDALSGHVCDLIDHQILSMIMTTGMAMLNDRAVVTAQFWRGERGRYGCWGW
jgi:hypothetical protein